MVERWGMVVDVNRCVGCQTCTAACKHVNDTTPGVQWRQVLDVEEGVFPDVERLFLVVGCQHCAEPPCVPVCPTGATVQRADGLVTMDYDLCIGCGYCAVACPYQARTIAHDKAWYYGEETVQERAVAHDDRQGVAQKCTFCVEKVDEAKALGLTPGIDLEVTPACAASCIAQAIHFGDFADQDSNVARLVAENPSFQMHAELGTEPQIRYLYETPAVPGRDPAPDEDESRAADPANPLTGAVQTFWDLRAALNFALGGMGAGLAAMASLAYLGGMPAAGLPFAYVGAAVLMAVGLFSVFLEIGRKVRFLYVLLRPQSSWMTRESYVVAVFYPLVAADLVWPAPALHVLVGLAALAFLYSQARLLHAGRGIPAWRTRLVPWLLVATGLYEGWGLLLLGAVAAHGAIAFGPAYPVAGLVLVAINAALWHRYRRTAKAAGIGPLARRALDDISPWLILGGQALPATLFVGALATSGAAAPMLAAAGLGAVAGGALLKITLITRASHQQGFALAKLPQRGSGTRAAPPLALPAQQTAP